MARGRARDRSGILLGASVFPMLPKDTADSPAALIALAGQHDSDGLLGQFKRGAHIINIIGLV
jgi:hypothetical protein